VPHAAAVVRDLVAAPQQNGVTDVSPRENLCQRRVLLPPSHGKCQIARFASVTTFWSAQKEPECHQTGLYYISTCVRGMGSAPNLAEEPYSAPPDLPAAFEPF